MNKLNMFNVAWDYNVFYNSGEFLSFEGVDFEVLPNEDFVIRPFTLKTMYDSVNFLATALPDFNGFDAEDGENFNEEASAFKFRVVKRKKGPIPESSSQPTFSYSGVQPAVWDQQAIIDLIKYWNLYPNMRVRNFILTSEAPRSLHKFSNEECAKKVEVLRKLALRDTSLPPRKPQQRYVPRLGSRNKPSDQSENVESSMRPKFEILY